MPCNPLLRCALFVFALATVNSVGLAEPIALWDLSGNVGNEISVSPTQEASGVSALNMMRGTGLTPNIGMDSFNSRGWNNPGATDYVQFGFDVVGTPWYVDDLVLATRSSATGPGTIDVQLSLDGAGFYSLTTLSQAPTAFLNSILAIDQLVSSNLTVRLYSANNTSADGETINGNGTFRIGNYSDGEDSTPVQFRGNATLVPEPTSIVVWMALFGVLGCAVVRRRIA